MKTSKRKKKKNKSNILTVLILIICCAGVGFFLGLTGVLNSPKDMDFKEFIIILFIRTIIFLLSYYMQIIIHEGGHLVTGLMTGYRFSSFRIGRIMLLKNHEGCSLRKFSLAGTGGQCLLVPPEKAADGSYHFWLYHLGGVLLNMISAALFFAVYAFKTRENFFLLFLAVSGVLCGVTNGIPVRISGIATDGYNVIHIGKEPFALEAMWRQLKINEAQTEGIRLKDLPKEWFTIPDESEKRNEIISTIAVFSENRAMDELDFSRAKTIINMLEQDDEYCVIGIYKNLLLCDKATIDMIEKGEKADISELNTHQLKAFRKSMAKYPAVLRTEYAIQILKEKNTAAAKKCRESFNRVAKTYPLSADISSESEILNYLDSCAKKRISIMSDRPI